MLSFIKYAFYFIILVALGYVAMFFYDYYQNDQPVEIENIVVSEN